MTASRPRNAAPYPVIWATPRGGHQCSDAPDLFDMAAQLCAVDARTERRLGARLSRVPRRQAMPTTAAQAAARWYFHASPALGVNILICRDEECRATGAVMGYLRLAAPRDQRPGSSLPTGSAALRRVPPPTR
jgi:phage tail tape-measure protein